MNRRRRDVNAWNPFTAIRDQFSCARRARRDSIATRRRVGYKLDTRDTYSTRIDHIVDFRSTRNRRESKSETHRRNHARYESAIPSAASFRSRSTFIFFFPNLVFITGFISIRKRGERKKGGGKKKIIRVVISEIIPRYRVAMTDSQ